MPVDSDVALLGTGVAPLAAASHLISQGKSVLLLNPDRDFFLESSELPLDPLLTGDLSVDRISRGGTEELLRELSPFFPGSLQNWPEPAPAQSQAKSFYDSQAPHVRSRSRLWFPIDAKLEDFYVEGADQRLNPQILEGIQAIRKFPGMGSASRAEEAGEDDRALLIPRLCDVDVSRYRNGLLEFIRERLGSERVICNASQIEPMPGGIRFHANGVARTARLRSGTLAFWTPRMTPWVLAQCKRAEMPPALPLGTRMWEQWSVVSREALDPGTVGIWKESLAVWADGEGIPSQHQIAVLRAGTLSKLDSLQSPALQVVSDESFRALTELFIEFLRWDKLTVRSMTARSIFEWNGAETTRLSTGESLIRIVPRSDGPLADVVRAARSACEELEE